MVIALAGIGDTLLATPLIHELRQQLPLAEIDVVVMWPDARDFLQTNPHISKLHYQHLMTAGPVANMRFLRALSRLGYDVSINAYPQSRLAYRVVARIISAPVRISHSYDNASRLDRLFVNRTLPQDYNLHVAENNLNLLRLIGLKPVLREHDTEIYFTDEELKWADNPVRSGEKIMGIHVGSGKTKNLRFKRWPIEKHGGMIFHCASKGFNPSQRTVTIIKGNHNLIGQGQLSTRPRCNEWGAVRTVSGWFSASS